MEFSRYKKQLIPYIILLIALSILIPFGMGAQSEGEGFLLLTIGNSTTSDTFFLIYSAIGTAILGAIIGGILFSRVFLFTLHLSSPHILKTPKIRCTIDGAKLFSVMNVVSIKASF